MVRVHLDTLVMGNFPGASVIVLRPLAGERDHDKVLPICIGPVEAAALGKAVSGEPSARPMTHSLIGSVIAQLGGKLKHVVIEKVRGTVFYATICIERGGQTTKIDARPSDAVTLAVRMKAPIYVSESVLASASMPVWVNGDKDRQRIEMEEFHRFVENLSPEDFAVHEQSKDD